MKRWVIVVACLFFSAGLSLRAAEAPQGELLELHSCQLYIGGCIASSEVTQDGHYLLRVWSFSGGSYEGSPLRGLNVALLEVSDKNLAAKGTQPVESMIYLPQSVDSVRSQTLFHWVKATNPELAHTKLRVRTVPMEFGHTDRAISFSAGDAVRIETKHFEPCGLISCGESLWYTPRSTVTSYTVEVTSETVVHEPALALRWIDHGKNNIFVGRFGDGATALAAFVSPTLVCAIANHPPHE
ncbi:MAG: hypothetical protein ABSG14_07140 [Verrucomicrobiia bacterium]|jgi:hypothetical protein